MGEDYNHAAVARRVRLLLVLIAVATTGTAVAMGMVIANRDLPHLVYWGCVLAPSLVWLALMPLWIPPRRRSRHFPDRFVETTVGGEPAYIGPTSVADVTHRQSWLVLQPAYSGLLFVVILWHTRPGWLWALCILGAIVSASTLGWRLYKLPDDGRLILWEHWLQVPDGRGDSTNVPWLDLMPGGVYVAGRRPRLTVLRGPAGAWHYHSIPLRWTAVNPQYLADVIRYYIQLPEYRERIGQPGEQERLHQAIVELRAAHAVTAGAVR